MPRRTYNSVRTNRKSLFRTTVGKKNQLKTFIKQTKGFNQHSYGEIQFMYQDNLSTYSQFVTLTPDISPEKVWKLFIELWELSSPNAIISVAGEFEKTDASWNEVVNQAWLITTGSSPCSQIANSHVIAIIPLCKVINKQDFFNDLPEACFPVFHQGMASRSKGKLDSYHSHYILVDGDTDSTIQLRHRILSYIGSVASEQETSNYATIPIANVLVSENIESWKVTSLAAISFPTVVAESAPKSYKMVYDVIKQPSQNPLADQSNVPPLFQSSKIDESVKNSVERCFNLWLLQPHTVTLYSKSEYEQPSQVIISAMLHCTPKIFSCHSMIHLAVAWDMISVVKNLIHSWKQFEDEKHNLLDYLALALTYDNAEFLEYFDELGINISSSLNMNTLRILYIQTLDTNHKQFETRSTFLVRKLFNNKILFPTSDVLHSIERIISHLTNHEVSGLYSNKVYKEKILTTPTNMQTPSRNLLLFSNSTNEDSDKPLYPERDLFLWCILVGKYKLAFVFWKQSSALAALCLIASAIIEGQESIVDACTSDDALAEELSEAKMFWKQTALDFIGHSYKKSRIKTLLYLTMPLEVYGGCSTLDLAYFTGQVQIISHPALQNALDLIWLGKTKKDSATWRTMLALICPFLVPFLDVVKINSTKNSNYEGVTATLRNSSTCTIDAGTCDMSRVERSYRNRQPKGFCAGLWKYGKAIHDYYNSPVIKFWIHLMFLTGAISCMCVSLVLGSVAYDGGKDATFNLTALEFDSEEHRYRTMNLPVLIALFSYIAGVATDELRQIATANDNHIRRRFQKWFASYWNRIDALMILSFFAGLVVYVYAETSLGSSFMFKFLFSVSLATMQLRFFQSYYVFRSIGPKVIMIKEMIKDLAVFFYIMIPIFFCYGFVLSSFIGNFEQYEISFQNNTAFGVWMLKFYNVVIRRPVWNLFIAGLQEVEDAPKDLDGLANSLLVAFYLLFSNILMINLLIALFNYTFEQIQENATECWKYQRFEIVHEFLDRPLLPSPFIIFEDLLCIVKWCKKKTSSRPTVDEKYRRFQENLSVNLQTEDIWNFEKEILQAQLKEKEMKLGQE